MSQPTTNLSSLIEVIKCIWIPTQAEAHVLLGKYVDDVDFTYHVVHTPSLPGIIDNLYEQLNQQAIVQPGCLSLFISIIASVTSQWTDRDAKEKGLFPSPNHASRQTILWIKAALDIVEYSRRTGLVALEHVQALIIISSLMCNLEGFSSKFRSAFTSAVAFAHELGLHRVDDGGHCDMTMSLTPLRAEMSRRIWWHLVGSDW